MDVENIAYQLITNESQGDFKKKKKYGVKGTDGISFFSSFFGSDLEYNLTDHLIIWPLTLRCWMHRGRRLHSQGIQEDFLCLHHALFVVSMDCIPSPRFLIMLHHRGPPKHVVTHDKHIFWRVNNPPTLPSISEWQPCLWRVWSSKVQSSKKLQLSYQHC